ncbi:MAG: glucosyltransferase domain-containing protein [Bacillota bacterium]|nr:glucosyltransferase domain-containing protein [Bacillota bacterium]
MTRKNIKNPYIPLFLLSFSMVVLRYVYFGFTYYPQLDDYIQYHNYASFNSSFFELAHKLGLFAARPISGSLDYLLWSHFWGKLIIAVTILSVLYAISGLIFYHIFYKKLHLTIVFLVFYCLFPLNIEGTYWVSASSRVVGGLFFAALSAFYFDRYSERITTKNILLVMLFQLISFGFYEQTMPLTAVLFFVLSLYSSKKLKTLITGVLATVLNAGIYFGFTMFFKNSSLYDGKLTYAFPVNRYYFEDLFPRLLDQLRSVFISAPVALYTTGFKRGMDILIKKPNTLFLLGLISLCIIVYIMSVRSGHQKNHTRIHSVALLCGIFIAALPLLVFFIAAEPWVSLRGAVMSFPGLAITASALVSLVSPLFKKHGGIFTACVCTALCFIFTVAGVSEVSDYKDTFSNDNKVVNAITGELKKYGEDQNAVILNVRPSYLKEQNYSYHEHIHGVTESDWALTGAVQAAANKPDVPFITPIAPNAPIYEPYDKFGEYNLSYILTDDFKLIRLEKKIQSDGTVSFYNNGRLTAKITEDNNGKRVLVKVKD